MSYDIDPIGNNQLPLCQFEKCFEYQHDDGINQAHPYFKLKSKLIKHNEICTNAMMWFHC